MIPKIIHYVHIKPLSKVEKQWINETKKNNPDFTIIIWNEKDTENLELSKVKILEKDGGICISTDIVFTKKIPVEWLSCDAIISKTNDWELSTEILGCVKKGRLVTGFFDNITQKAYKTFGKYSMTYANNNKLKDLASLKILESPKLFPHKLPKKSTPCDLCYEKRWDNYTTNIVSKLNVIEL